MPKILKQTDLFVSHPEFSSPEFPSSWLSYLEKNSNKASKIVDKAIKTALSESRKSKVPVLPIDPALWFRAFELTPPESTKVIIIAMDPYPNRSHAMGIALSVPKGVTPPRSLANIYRELETDLAIPVSKSGDLSCLSRQGVLLANAWLTLPEGSKAGTHKKIWKEFTHQWISTLGKDTKPRVWVLWGQDARSFKDLIASHHVVIESVHPSPLSARRGFFGSQPFSRVNDALHQMGHKPIKWEIV